jgi:ABC-type sugar transport system ATPase subunit
MNAALLECLDLTVNFGRQRALDGFSFTLQRGEIVGLVGANGAGKSTLGRVLVGEIPFGSYSGELKLEGAEKRFEGSSIRKAQRSTNSPSAKTSCSRSNRRAGA